MTTKQRVEQHDREIAAIRKLLHTGMKLIVRIEKRIDNLAAAQVKTEKALQNLMGANGHSKRKLDV